MQEIREFLRKLKENNEREWFYANKKEYQATREQFFGIVEDIIAKLAPTDPRLTDVTAKETVFRLNRDIRFSKDKSPYKTHYGAFIAPGGKKGGKAGYYFHVAPDEVFLAAGVYQPEKEALDVIRQEIMFQPEKYKKMLGPLLDKGYSMMEEDKLKNGPKGFDKDSPHIDLVKYKHYILSRRLSEKESKSAAIAETVSKYFLELVPMNNFLNTAMEFTGNE